MIVQNFRAKPGTRMSGAAEPTLADHAWTIAVARLVLGPAMNIQAPPNLQPDGLAQLVRAGINDWGGVSPVTPDHVNPEAPWPHLADLERATAPPAAPWWSASPSIRILAEHGSVALPPWEKVAEGRMRGPSFDANETPPSRWPRIAAAPALSIRARSDRGRTPALTPSRPGDERAGSMLRS